jgi:pilus assembly protein CpaF
MAGLNFPVHAIREQISSAINLMVQVGRITGGRRRIKSITEITGMEGETVCTQDIFRFKQTGVDKDGHATGYFEACGCRPQSLERIQAEGIEFPPDMFRARPLSQPTPPAGR